MRAYISLRSTKLIFLLLFLGGALSLSAVTFAGSVFTPIGTVSEGSLFASVVSSLYGPSDSAVPAISGDPASVRTNKAHYSPGDTAKITGENFGPFETVTLQVTHNDGTPDPGAGHEPWTVTSDGSGFFITTWYVDPDDSLDSTFLLTAVSATASASTTFSDPGPSADLDQCRNGTVDDPALCIGDGSGASGWVNGNVGGQQGHLIEGYSIPYRMRMEELTAGNWTLDIGYDTIHEEHAIDFLTHYDLSGGSNLTPTVPSHNLVFGHASECKDPSDSAIGGAANANNCPPIAASTSTFNIPKPIIPDSADGDPPCDQNQYTGGEVEAGAISCPGETFDAIAAAGQAYMTMWNGTITNIEYVQGQQNVDTGGGKQHTMVRVYFTVSPANVAADNGNVVLAWGGHIAREQDWGDGNSASAQSGSPYHMNLHGLCAGSTANNGTLCTDGGAQDRSLSAAAVFETGTVIIRKEIQNNTLDGTFGYTATGSGLPSSFSLTTVNGFDEEIFSGLLPGAKTVNETTIPNTHLFVSLVCQDPDGGTTVSGTTANIDLDGNETVICTYVNRENRNVTDGRIIVVKDTVPDDTTDFTFTTGGYTSVVEGNPFTLKDGESNDSCGAGNDNCLEPGTYSVAETANNNYETTSSCTDGSPVTAISVQAGETVTCTFVNRKKPDVSITKVADAGTVSAGTAIGFTLTVTNLGPNDAKDVTLTDTLPTNAGLNWSINGGTGAADCSISGGVLTCNFGTLASGATRTVHITSPTTAATCGVVNNTGTVTASNEIPGATGNNSASASVTVNCPDVTVLKTAIQTPVSAGTSIAFNIVVSNIGLGTATGVVLTDTLPSTAGLNWSIDGANTTAPNCSITAGVLTCNIGTLAPAASVQVRLTSPTTEATCGVVSNTGVVSATNEAASNTGNNSSTANITVQCPNLSITKVADAASVSAGSQIGFTITVTNSAAAGTGTATGVTLSDSLPAGTGVDWLIQSQSGGAACVITGSPGSEVLSCGPIDLAPGASFSVHVVSGTTEASCKAYPNTATADATNAPQVQAQASTTVQCPDLQILKTASSGTINAGTVASFTILVSNAGPGTATSVTLTDPLPAGVAWAITGGTGAASCVDPIVGNTLSCNFGDMAAGASFTVIVSGMTDAADCGTLNNTAVADSGNDAPVQSSASIVVQCGRLIVDKVTVPSGDPTSFAFTGSFSFSLTDAATPFNSGLIAPGTYTVGETTPDGWVLTSATCSDGSDPSSISISGNETVTCTFTNSKLPTLIVRKVIQGGSETFNFVIAGNPTNPPNTNVSITPAADSEAQTPSQVIQLGDYSVTETPIPAGWLLTDASCVSDQGSFVTDNTGLPVVTFTARYGDDIVCTFIDNQQGGTTRTQGFWATHTVLTNTFWMGGTLPEGTAGNLENWVPVINSEDAFLCKTPLVVPLDGVKITAIAAPGQNQVMGGFWSNIAKKSDNKKRTALDQARMQFLQQYLAAVLNVHAFGTPIGTTTLAQARAAYCGSNANAISAQMSLLAAYNEGGDTGEFTPGANATAKLSREQANIPFWDTTFR